MAKTVGAFAHASEKEYRESEGKIELHERLLATARTVVADLDGYENRKPVQNISGTIHEVNVAAFNFLSDDDKWKKYEDLKKERIAVMKIFREKKAAERAKVDLQPDGNDEQGSPSGSCVDPVKVNNEGPIIE